MVDSSAGSPERVVLVNPSNSFAGESSMIAKIDAEKLWTDADASAFRRIEALIDAKISECRAPFYVRLSSIYGSAWSADMRSKIISTYTKGGWKIEIHDKDEYALLM